MTKNDFFNEEKFCQLLKDKLPKPFNGNGSDLFSGQIYNNIKKQRIGVQETSHKYPWTIDRVMTDNNSTIAKMGILEISNKLKQLGWQFKICVLASKNK